jgi:hypothetical protein
MPAAATVTRPTVRKHGVTFEDAMTVYLARPLRQRRVIARNKTSVADTDRRWLR